MRILYLGDIHGEFSVVHRYVKKYDIRDAHIIQVGDFGVGFSTLDKERRWLGMHHDLLVKQNVVVWAIRGNHDFKPYFDNDPFGFSNIRLVRDYEVLELAGRRILCVGGAVSVDRWWRYTDAQRNGNMEVRPGQSWWHDEPFVLDAERVAALSGIDTVVTHTAPSWCSPDNSAGLGAFVEGVIRKTGDAGLRGELNYERQQVGELFHLLRLNGNSVEFHYYGHFHASDTTDMYGVRHRLLNIDEMWEEPNEEQDDSIS